MIRRRLFISAPLATIGGGLGTGCLPFVGLMRFGMRGAAIRGGARAARSGARGNLSSLGRTGAAALHAVRLFRLAQATAKLIRIGDVFGIENGQEAVCFDTDGRRVECAIDGVIVCSTHLQGQFFEHISPLFGSCGTSRATTEREIHHWDNKGVFAGADILENNQIRHVGSNHQLLGYTRLQVTQRSRYETVTVVERDSFLNAEMAELEKMHRDLLGAAGARDLGMIADAQTQCAERSLNASCRDLQVMAENALLRLESRFRQFT